MKIQITILLLLVSYLCKAQITDNFDSYANNSYLNAQSNWTSVKGGTTSIMINNFTGTAGVAQGNAAGECSVMRTGTWNNNQSSQIVYKHITTANYLVLSVRNSTASGGSYYAWGGSNTDSYFVKVVNGTPSYPISAGSAWQVNHTYKLQIIGNELRFYDNGVLDNSMSSDGIYTDATITSGNPGLGCYGSGQQGDNWQGNSIISSATVNNKLIWLNPYYTERIIPLQDIIYNTGINDTIVGPEDYDGICQSGKTRDEDADCGHGSLSRLPVRKVLSSADFSQIIYINPTAAAGGTGSYLSPYDSWADVLPIQPNTAYLQKCGTTAIITTQIDILANNVLIGSYGAGNIPIVQFNGNIRGFVFNGTTGIVRMLKIREVYITCPDHIDYGDSQFGEHNSKSGIELWGHISADIYKCTIDQSGFGIRCGSGSGDHAWNKEVRLIGLTVKHTVTEGFYGFGELYDIAFCNFSGINELALIQPEINYNGGSNNGSTGDVIEVYDWYQMWIHNNRLNHGSTPNKNVLMLHNQTSTPLVPERLIIENNRIIGPQQGSSAVNRINAACGMVLRNNMIFESPLNNNSTTCIWNGIASPDSGIGNVIVGFQYVLYQNYNTASIWSNNTFWDNNYCIAASSSKTISKFQNNNIYNNINVLTNVTATTTSNNYSSNPNYVNPGLSPYTSNFSLQPTSGAINYRTPLTYRTYDLLGNPVTGNLDAGAYEYIP